MFTSEIAVALTIGVSLSLLFAELFGTLPGGLVVPGFLALSWRHPYSVLTVFLIGLLTFLIVGLILDKWVILYGRRKFVAMLLTGIGLSVGLNSLIPALPIVLPPLTGVGIIVPGLIANCFHKQGFLHTFLAMAVLTGMTIICVRLYYQFI